MSSRHDYWVTATNDHIAAAAALEWEHRHKAVVESGVRELKENIGLSVLRKQRVHGELGVAPHRGN